MYLCARCIDVASPPYFYYMLELLQQCCILCLFLSYVGTVPTVWYFFVYFYHMLELFQQVGIFCFSLYQYVVIKLRNSIKRIPLHIRRSNPPHVTACVNPLSRLPTPYIAVFFILFWIGRPMSLSTSLSHRSDNAHHCWSSLVKIFVAMIIARCRSRVEIILTLAISLPSLSNCHLKS